MSYYSSYHWCAVPKCKNTSVKTPDKLWIQVPTDINMRKAWFELARRNLKLLHNKSRLYFCGDHFDLENDMENYMRYKIMGSVDRIRLKPNCVPSRFDCHRKDKFASNEYCHLGKAKRLSTSKDSVQDLNEEDNDNASSSCNEGLLACYKIACEKCNNDIASGEIHYIAANLGPELLFIFEQEVAHELGSEAAICEACFNSVMDIIDSIHNITEVIEDNTVEPIRTNNTYACVWCLASLANRRSQHLPNGVHKDAISNLIAPRQIPDGGALCYRCWSRACRLVRSSKSGQSQHICVWCKRSIAQRRSHSIPNGPERDVITAKISPRQIRPLDRVCYACWVSARRIVQRATKPPRNINRNFCVACAISVVKRQTRLLLHGPEKNAISRRIYPRQVSDNSLVCKHCWTWAQDAVRRENEQPVEAVPNEDEPPQVFDMPRNIQLKTYRKVGMSSSSCFVPGCTNTERLLVPRVLRKTLLSNYKIYVADYARVCLVHKTTSDWDHAFNLEALNCVFSAEEIEKMMKVIK